MLIDNYVSDLKDGERQIPFHVVTIGENKKQHRIHRPAGVVDYQLLYTVSGRGIVRIRNEEFAVTAGSIFILPPFTPHEYRAEGDEWKTCWITYNGRGAERCFPFSCDIRYCDEFMRIYSKILKESRKDNWRMSTSFMLYELLLRIYNSESLRVETVAKNETDISTAVQYISSHYTETVELSCLAELVGVSEGHFCRIFKEYTHMRPIEYITHLKIERAKAYLVESKSMTVSCISKAVGYSNPAYFSKVFREKVGMSAERYRREVVDRE